MVRQHRPITHAAAIALALAATAAPRAWADPQSLAKAQIAANQSQASPVVRPNADEQVPWKNVRPAPSHRTASPPVQPNPDELTVTGGGVSAGHTSGVVSGSRHGPGSVPPRVVRVGAGDLSFDWGDAGIGAGAAFLLIGIGVAVAQIATGSRKRHAREQRATATG